MRDELNREFLDGIEETKPQIFRAHMRQKVANQEIVIRPDRPIEMLTSGHLHERQVARRLDGRQFRTPTISLAGMPPSLAQTHGYIYLSRGFSEKLTIMLEVAVKALGQILSPPMRSILWRSIGLALVLIVVLAIGLQRLLSWSATSGEGWAEAMLGPGFHTPLDILAWIVSIAAGLGVVFGAVFLMPAITSLVASVFVDEAAEHVEREHYPAERPGTALPFGLAATEGVMTALLTIL